MTSTAAALRTPRRGPATWRTFALLKVLRNVLVCLNLALLAATLHALDQEQQDLRQLGEQVQPAFQSAFEMENSLQALQVASLKSLLGGQGATLGGEQGYEEQRADAVRNLLHASRSSSKSAQAEAALESIALDLGMYERLVARSQELQKADLTAASAAFRQAAHLVDTTMLPAGKAMEDAELAELHDLRRQQDLSWARTTGFLNLASGCLLLTLVLAQLSLSRRTRRTFNLALVAATALLVLSSLHIAGNLATAREDMVAMRDQDLISAEHVWQLRQHAFAAEADDGQRFASPANSSRLDQSFREETEAVAQMPDGLTAGQLIGALREGGHVDGFSGLFATAIEGAPSPGKREELLSALAAWQALLQQHANEDVMLRSGQKPKALEFYLHGASNDAVLPLQRLNQALQSIQDQQRDAMERSLSRGEQAVRQAEPETVAALGLFGLLIVLAFAPRIREYA